VTIDRLVQEVFAFVRDPEAVPQWQAGGRFGRDGAARGLQARFTT